MDWRSEDKALLCQGIEDFRAGDYFAAHDAWEEVWQGLRGRRRVFWQAMIHLAVGAYHLGNHNLRGCQSQWQKALHKCATLYPEDPTTAPLPLTALTATLQSCLSALEISQEPWPSLQSFATSMNLEAWLAFV